MKEQKNLPDKETPYKEFLGRELNFFDENNEIKKFKIRKIVNNCFILRKEDEERMIDIEVPIIEVLTLNFPDSEDYVFPKEEWKNFWLKYGGYLPPQVKIDKDQLSIKEAREIFSKLPSEFEKNLLYFLMPNETIYSFFIEIENKIITLDEISYYLNQFAALSTMKNLTYLFDYYLSTKNKNLASYEQSFELERQNSIKRYQFFGKPRELELYNQRERDNF